MKKIWIFIAVSGALAVIMGAMSAHMLKDVLAVNDIARHTNSCYLPNVPYLVACSACSILPIQPIKSHQAKWLDICP